MSNQRDPRPPGRIPGEPDGPRVPSPAPEPAPGAGFPGMLRFDVFGQPMGVERQGAEWRLYLLDNPAGRRPAPNIVIPHDLEEAGLAGHLADLFHESARPGRADVRRL
jgi:hypothetical protein